MTDLTHDVARIKAEYVGAKCTLNGEPAKVIGRGHRFATVAPFDHAKGAVEYSWPTVARVMARDKAFRS